MSVFVCVPSFNTSLEQEIVLVICGLFWFLLNFRFLFCFVFLCFSVKDVVNILIGIKLINCFGEMAIFRILIMNVGCLPIF